MMDTSLSDASPQPEETDLLRLIDSLGELIKNGKYLVFDKVFIDEQAFFIQTSKLKKALPEVLKKAERIVRDRAKASIPSDEPALNVVRLIDELEQLVEHGKYHVFDKVLVDQQAFLALLAKLKQAVPRDLANVQVTLRNYSEATEPLAATARPLLDQAHVEAQRIIQEAQREARRIVAEARRNAPPFSSLSPDATPPPFSGTDTPFGDAPSGNAQPQ